MKYIKFFNELTIKDIPLVGGKNASLGEMVQKLGKKINIPDGFAVTAKGYEYFLEKAGINDEIRRQLLGLDTRNLRELSERSGPWGVRIFFIVSGYIITLLMLKEEAKRGSLDVGAFYVRRIFRILPAFSVYLAALAAVGALGWFSIAQSDVVNAALFACNTGVECGWGSVHTWTLAIEMQFYLLWPLLFVLLPKWMRVPGVTALIACLLALSATETFLARGWIDNAASAACIALGALCAMSPEFCAWVKRYGLLAVLAAVAVVGMLYAAHETALARMLYRALIPLGLLAVVFGAYAIPRFSEWRISIALSKLGLISYSLYLWQQLFFAPAELYPVTSILFVTPLVFGIAALSYLAVEKPAQTWAKSLLQRRALRAKV